MIPQIKAARAAGNCSRGVPGSLSGDVAIKEIVPPPNLTTEARQELRVRSLREARAIAQLDHVNVVRVFDVLLSADGDPQIVMEYVPSRSLHDAITTDGPIPPVRAAAIGLAVLGALRAAHRPGSCIATSNRPTSSSARTAGAAIQLTTCNTTPAQQFTLDGDQHLVNAHSGMCLGAVGQSTASGALIEQRSCGTGTNHLRWTRR